MQSNFFRHLQTNPIEEFENREFTNFIIQHVHEIDPTENNEQQVMPGQPQVSRSQTLAFDLLSRRRNNCKIFFFCFLNVFWMINF